MRRWSIIIWLAAGFVLGEVLSFSPQSRVSCVRYQARQTIPCSSKVANTVLGAKGTKDASEPSNEGSTCWNPKLRRTIGLISLAGVLETGYLTYSKFVGTQPLCGTSGSCSSVLSGPYAYIPGTEIPLSILGLVAYSIAAFLALGPVLKNDSEDEMNRILLASTTTTMGIFSACLMYLLFGVLKENCPYCVASALFSISMAKLSWLGGVVPKDRLKEGLLWSTGGVATALCAGTILFTSVDSETDTAKTNFAGTPTTLLAQGNTKEKFYEPPPIQTTSSPQALKLAQDLALLDAKMYGAYWCSHCFDQKSAFGKEAFSKVIYLECAKDGMNSQSNACKARDVPGYPTWEIGGKLFPGEQALEELEEIVQTLKSSRS